MGTLIETFKMTLVTSTILLAHFSSAQEPTNQNVPIIEDKQFKRSPADFFNSTDLNSDRQINWAEVKARFGKELHKLEWDEQDVFRSFDTDNDMSLDEEEFQRFREDLQDKLEIYRLPELSLAQPAGPPPKPAEYKEITNASHYLEPKLKKGPSSKPASNEEAELEHIRNYEGNKISAIH